MGEPLPWRDISDAPFHGASYEDRQAAVKTIGKKPSSEADSCGGVRLRTFADTPGTLAAVRYKHETDVCTLRNRLHDGDGRVRELSRNVDRHALLWRL